MPRPWTRRLSIAGALLAVTALGATQLSSWGDAATGTASRYITDAQGRALILRGLNTASSAKSAPDGMPDYPEKMVEAERTTLGSNFVRFLIQWRNVEPSPGAYDEKYLDQVAERVSWYAKRGVNVMLDMHQDVYGPATSDGNGAPAWATKKDGLQAKSQDPWELGYVQPGTMRAFDNFWNTTGDHPELQRHYVDAWKHVARRFAADKTVIGYDLMNEPWGGSLPGVAFERGPLSDLYQRTTNAIRQVDPDKWVFVEPRAVGVNWGLASGLRPIDDPRPGEDRIGYAPHLYLSAAARRRQRLRGLRPRLDAQDPARLAAFRHRDCPAAGRAHHPRRVRSRRHQARRPRLRARGAVARGRDGRGTVVLVRRPRPVEPVERGQDPVGTGAHPRQRLPARDRGHTGTDPVRRGHARPHGEVP